MRKIAFIILILALASCGKIDYYGGSEERGTSIADMTDTAITSTHRDNLTMKRAARASVFPATNGQSVPNIR